MSAPETYGVGGARFPLTTDLTNSMLEDADPSVFHFAAFVAAMLNKYIAPRLLAAAELEGLKFPSAVETIITVEPAPYLLAHNFKFPLLAVYPRSDTLREKTMGWESSECTIEFAWVLPPLTPRQADKLAPILRAAARMIGQRIRAGADSAYLSGTSAWRAAGIERIQLDSTRYGAWGSLEDNAKLFRSLVGTVRIWERDGYLPTDFETLEGVNIAEDLTSSDGTTIADFVLIETKPAAVLANVAPTGGDSAGGDAVTLTGSGFTVGTTPLVFFGDERARDVVVVNATTITCTTPTHAAFPTAIVDVFIVDVDGLASNTLADAFTFTTP